MSAGPKADVVLVGLGAAGGIAAHVLTGAGLDVVALEAGGRLDPSMMTLDELRNDVRGWMSAPKASRELPTFRSSPSGASVPAPFPTLMMNAIGGTTVHYPGLSIRFQPWNFRSRSAVIERYGTSAIPEGSTLADWPLDYEELEPFYDTVERAIGVAGTAATVGAAIDPEGNAFEGVRARAYPMRAVRRTGWTELTAAAARELGWHPFPAPAAVNTEVYNGNPDVHVLRILLVERVLPRCEGLHRRQRDPMGRGGRPAAHRVGRARDPDRGRRSRPRSGRHVRPGWARALPSRHASSCSVRSRTRTRDCSSCPRRRPFPRGLSNNHGQVGKHFTAHATPFVYGLFPGRRLNLFNGLWAQATCLEDWNADNFDHAGLGFVGGAMLAAPQEAKPIAAASAPLPERVPRWGSSWKSWLAEHAQSIGYVTAQFDSLTYETNGLDLDPTVVDTNGVPVVRVTLALQENEHRGYDFMLDRLRRWLVAAGAAETWHGPGRIIEGRHCYGGTRMGDIPETSVVDRYGFSHEVPNLGDHRRIDVPDGGWLEPDADRPGARLANGATTGGQLERDRGCSVITGARIRPRIE